MFVLLRNLWLQEQPLFYESGHSGRHADPSIIRIDDTYYATGTSSEWAPFYPVFTSKDMVNWKQAGHIFSKQPSWTSNSFWAPELFYHNSKVYCYYTARQKSTGISYIGVATRILLYTNLPIMVRSSPMAQKLLTHLSMMTTDSYISVGKRMDWTNAR